MQRIEGMEKFFLGPFLLRQKLNVVYQQHVHVAELVAEAGHLVVTQRVDHLVGELLAGEIADGSFRLALLHLVSYGLHEVSLAHSHAAIKEKRVVGLGGALGDGLRGGVRELIAAADDEVVKLIFLVEKRGGIPIEARLLAGGCGCYAAASAGAMSGYRAEAAVMADVH